MERSMFEFSFLSLQDNNITSVGYARLLDAVNTCIRNGIHVDLSMVGNPLSERERLCTCTSSTRRTWSCAAPST